MLKLIAYEDQINIGVEFADIIYGIFIDIKYFVDNNDIIDVSKTIREDESALAKYEEILEEKLSNINLKIRHSLQNV